MLGPLPWRLANLRSACRCESEDEHLDALIRALVVSYEHESTDSIKEFHINEGQTNLSSTPMEIQTVYRWLAHPHKK